MEVILLDDVPGLGDLGEVVKVRPGYGRNYLIPQQKAVYRAGATGKQLAHQIAQLEKKKKRLQAEALSTSDKIRNLAVNMTLKVTAGKVAFGSITNRDIAAVLKEQHGIELDRRRFSLVEPIKTVGTHFVKVKLHSAVIAQVKVKVEPEEVAAAEEEALVDQARSQLEEDFADSSEDDYYTDE